MINYVDYTISQGPHVEPIECFAVWFRTPLGLHRSVAEANDTCRKHEMPPQFSVVPVPVAVGQGTLYEEVPR